ncbi:hypothetical protein MATL_G00055600 [Megalops atlanticus]|uniref:Secreted protein n=1 Tax=Megalops atlanticus TaxID=7932 RepID=A0A9D3QGU1_MEGAT|nr:hypothetical protein MATL_G00055600 [Megalops atlanticus]
MKTAVLCVMKFAVKATVLPCMTQTGNPTPEGDGCGVQHRAARSKFDQVDSSPSEANRPLQAIQNPAGFFSSGHKKRTHTFLGFVSSLKHSKRQNNKT